MLGDDGDGGPSSFYADRASDDFSIARHKGGKREAYGEEYDGCFAAK